MLLIDGIRYKEWVHKSEEEFEEIIKEHAKDIFGEQSIYLDRKQKLKSLSGIGSVPDRYVIAFGDSPEWHIVEVELSSHPLYEHIVSQVSKFISGISNPNIQRGIVNAIDGEIKGDDFLKLRLGKAIEPTEIYRFLSDLISKQPILTIVIEKDTEELREALNTLRYPQIEVVEFQTFTREGLGLDVHAHLFEPLYKPVVPTEPQPITREVPIHTMEIKVWPAYIKYEYIGIWRKFRHLFPAIGTKVELVTDDGEIFQAQVGETSGSMELWYLKEWYKKNPHLKEGDLILITPVEPMKRYHLQIRRQQP